MHTQPDRSVRACSMSVVNITHCCIADKSAYLLTIQCISFRDNFYLFRPVLLHKYFNVSSITSKSKSTYTCARARVRKSHDTRDDICRVGRLVHSQCAPNCLYATTQRCVITRIKRLRYI